MMNPTPDDGDFTRESERILPTHSPADNAAALDADRAGPLEQVLAFVSSQRFYLLGLMATATMAVAAALAFLVALAIDTDTPVSGFLLDLTANSSYAQVIREGIHSHYTMHKAEIAEEFQATGKVPPGVSVTQEGNNIVVDGQALRQQMPLVPIMAIAATMALVFGYATWWIYRYLLALAPRAVTPRALWTSTVVLITLEVWAYSIQGIAGLSVLLLFMGGTTAFLLFLVRRWRALRAVSTDAMEKK